MIKTKRILTCLLIPACVTIFYCFNTESEYIINGEHITRLPFIQIYLEYILVATLLILYALFCMCADNFLKKQWKKKNYIPVLIIVGSCAFIAFLWHIDNSIRIHFT